MQRTCAFCEQTDDHPHHSVVLQIQPELIEVSMHLDCCALARRCPSCAAQVAGANGATGDAMRRHLAAFHARQGV
jgi:hypothetical protein